MKKIIASEDLAQLAFCLAVFFMLPNHFSIGVLIAVFFAPDVFAIGFLWSNKLGTILYNFSHHKLTALTLTAVGYVTHETILLQTGIIVYAHSSFDRCIGYGLKYFGNPSHTHLGYIGKEKYKNAPDGL